MFYFQRYQVIVSFYNIQSQQQCRIKPWQGPWASSFFGPLDIPLPLNGCMGPWFWWAPALGEPLASA